MKPSKRLLFKCIECGSEKEYIPWRAKRLKLNNGEYRCIICSRSHNASQQTFEQRSARMKQFHATNPEMAKIIGKIRRSYRHTPSEVWHQKQMDTIRADPQRYQQYCEKRRRIALEFHSNMTEIEKEFHYGKVFGNTSGKSEAEREFFKILESRGIKFDTGQCVCGFFPDGLKKDIKLIVEFYGDTYHCNPKKFHDPTQYCLWIRRTVQEQWDRDKKRLAVFYKHGYNVIIIWESDWRAAPEECIRRITDALQIN